MLCIWWQIKFSWQIQSILNQTTIYDVIVIIIITIFVLLFRWSNSQTNNFSLPRHHHRFSLLLFFAVYRIIFFKLSLRIKHISLAALLRLSTCRKLAGVCYVATELLPHTSTYIAEYAINVWHYATINSTYICSLSQLKDPNLTHSFAEMKNWKNKKTINASPGKTKEIMMMNELSWEVCLPSGWSYATLRAKNCWLSAAEWPIVSTVLLKRRNFAHK